ncbi:MAG: glycosyltransferase family 4 protein [Rhodospirillales bacterium]|nr:glycosyltransferase family 4 protein [Rhodospirillales bacterium]
MKPIIAVILPPREGFAPGDTGAVGLLVRRLAAWPGDFAPVVVGAPAADPFAGIAYRAIRPSWLPGRHTARYGGGVARAIHAIAPALVEVHNRPELALHLAARFPGLPVTLHLHNDPQDMRQARRPADRARLLARLAGIATVSNYVRARLLDGLPDAARAPPACPVVVLPNCLDPREIPPPADATRAPEILFAGRMVADKGADRFVAACALALPRLPGWRAEMIGADRFGPHSPETPWLAALRPQAAAAGIALAGYRPHEAVLAAMARASIVVVPSRWPEPFGLTALEAMACGAALLCAMRGGLPEVVGEAALPIDPDDVPAMAAAIVALAADPARRAALGAAGRARARLFGVAEAAARLDAMRRDVLHAWPPAGRRPI